MYINFKKEKPPVHNLTKLETIPEFVLFILSFGLKFCFLKPFNSKNISSHFEEAIRKISWVTYFSSIKQNSLLSNFDKFIIKVKKATRVQKLPCEIQKDIFPNPNLTKTFLSIISKKYHKENFMPDEIMNNFTDFVKKNNLIIKNADKNAGICVMEKTDYNNEVLRQLEDETIYVPTTSSHFNLRMSQFIDRVKSMKIEFNDDKCTKLNSLINYNYKPANFYILPKIHKPFTDFPIGRPISSTCNTINRYISEFVDFILKPIITYIPNLLVDTNHFLLLLEDLQLNPLSKYVLITYDISSMYTSLKLENCKKYCCTAFETYRSHLNLPYNFTTKQFNEMLNLSLDYNYIQFNNQYFTQVQGIQMGNSASVTVANITAWYEMRTMFTLKPEIECDKRFVDDGFILVNCDNIPDINLWCENIFKQDYLKFTIDHSFESITFLDVTVALNMQNKIATSLYSKPMAKNVFLHYESNHPKSLIESLPFSQGLRIKKICSEERDVENELVKLLSKFKKRGYPDILLENIKHKINVIPRKVIITPKTYLVRQHLMKNNPTILCKYDTIPFCNTAQNNKIYLVLPYYKNMYGISNLLTDYIKQEKERSTHTNYKNIISNLHLVTSFKKVNCLEKYCK